VISIDKLNTQVAEVVLNSQKAMEARQWLRDECIVSHSLRNCFNKVKTKNTL